MKRKSAFKSLTAVLAVSLVSGGIALLSQAGTGNVTASAATGETFKMDTVAAVRIPDADKQGDVSGIRFYAHMDEATKANAEEYGYGFLVFPQRYLPSELPENYNYHTQLLDKIDFEGDPAKIYENGDLFTANGVIAPVDKANYDEAFTCVAYVKTATAGEYMYATIDKDFSRNVLQVASAAYIAEPEHRSALKSAYELGTTNPVQIADGEDLELISKAVANGENFTDVKFELVNDITLRYGYTPIPENFAGEIKGNNKTVTGSFNADIAANGNVVTGTLTTTAKTPDKLVDIATEADLISSATASQKREILSKEEWAAEGLTGNYTGNALKIYGSEMQTTTLKYYLTIPAYTEDEIAEIKATYKYVNFWIAKNEVGTSFGGVYNNDVALSAQDSLTKNVWKKSTITVDEYFAAVAGKTKECLIYTWTEANKAPNAVIYFGDIEFYTEYDARFVYDATTVAPKTYMTKAEWEQDGITGDYTGNAVKFTNSSQTNSLRYYMTPPVYTETQITKIKNTYDYVGFWIAMSDAVGTPFYGLWNNTTEGNQASAFGAKNVWHKFSITVEEYFAYLEANADSNGLVQMLYVYVDNKATAPNAELYFGNIEFYTEIPTTLAKIEKTGSWSGKYGWSNSGAHKQYFPFVHNDLANYYIDVADVPALNISGTYSGGSIARVNGSHKMNAYNICARSALTDNQWNYIVANQDDYESVRFYVAVIDQGAAGEDWHFTIGTTKDGIFQYANEFTNGTYTFNKDNNKTWVEFNIPIDKFIENYETAVTAGNATYNWIALFNKTSASNVDNAAIYLYFGETRFIKKAS